METLSSSWREEAGCVTLHWTPTTRPSSWIGHGVTSYLSGSQVWSGAFDYYHMIIIIVP